MEHLVKKETEKQYLTTLTKTDYKPVLKAEVRIQKPLILDVIKEDFKNVKIIILKKLIDVCDLLGVKLEGRVHSLLAETIIEEFKHNSIDSILLALDNGAKGKYGKHYNSMNMPMIAEWIGAVLEEDAKAREKVHQNKKTDYPEVDYAQYKKNLEDEKLTGDKRRSALNMLTPEERQKRVNQILKDIEELEG